MNTAAACACGCAAPHVVARRESADGAKIHFWSDGGVTGPLGTCVIVQPAKGYRRAKVRAVIDIALAHVETCDRAEVTDLMKLAHRAVFFDMYNDDVRRRWVARELTKIAMKAS